MLGPGGTMSGMYFDDARGLRKRNKKYKLLQSYLPLLGWGVLSLLAIILAFREHRFSGARHTLREAHKDMQSLQNQQVQMQAMSVQKDQSIRQLNARISQAERDLKRAQDKFQEEKVQLTNRETELLKAKADSIAVHEELKEVYARQRQAHLSVSEKASSCDEQLASANAKLGELSKSLSQQYSVASELRRNLEAEAALHTSNEERWRSQEADLRRQLSGLEDHHASCTTKGSADHSHEHADQPTSPTSGSTQPLASALPSREMLQQAHPGIAAAADILLGQAALNATGKTTQSLNSSQAAMASNGSEAAASRAPSVAASRAGAGAAGNGAEGQAKEPEIPWRQVAGLLHSQGVTDPQGLGHMTETLKTFVGARLAVDKDRKETSDVAAEDDALVSLLAGAGISDPNGRGHFAQALREHLLSTHPKHPISIGSQTEASGASSESSSSDGKSVQTDVDLQQKHDAVQSDAQTQPSVPVGNHNPGHAHHGISSHGHRAFLIDENNQAGNAADKGSESKQTA
ncbi:TPA: hypothetical protein ACH3X1_002590 [Trebouxia sp. C0004]